jgi:hypothetical protein
VTLSQDNLERTFDWFEAALARDATLRSEFSESRRAYFAHRASVAALDALAHRRHLEWFLLERFSPGRGGVPIEVLLHEARAAALEADEGETTREVALAAMLASLASVFEVTSVLPGEGAWVRDLGGGGEYALEEPEASYALQLGDLLVGRLFDVGDTVHRMSSAAGFFRDKRLREAVERDLQRARASRRGSLRLSQAELERMFWGDPGESRTEVHPGAKARELLIGGGAPPDVVDSILADLAATPFDQARVVHGAGDALGEALDRLAFETSVDLEAARQALFEAWAALAVERDAEERGEEFGEGERAQEIDVAAAISAFDQGREAGRDLDLLFQQLERDLGLDGDEEGREDEPVPDFPGAVGAVVEEYLWDLARQGEDELARSHAVLRKLGAFGTSIGVFENLTARDLLTFCSVWIPEFGGLREPEEARSLLDALKAFCAWCEEQQDLPIAAEFAALSAGLESSLPRVIVANRACEPGADLTTGRVFEVATAAAGRLSVRDAQGDVHEVAADGRLTPHLRPGDRMRAELRADPKTLRVLCCYPPESARLQPR